MRVPIGGGPKGNEPSLSITDLADRELDCIAYLKTRAEIDPKRVGIIGQSIGGFVGMTAAARATDLAFLVTLATPLESIDQTFLDALDRVLTSGNAPEKERAKIRAMMVAVFADAANGAIADQLRPKLDEFFRAEYKWLPDGLRTTAGKDADEFIERVLDDHLRDTTSPMFRSLIGQDPVHTLAKIHCPVLVFFAEKDFKVDPQRSSRIANHALSQSGVEKWDVKVIPAADHFFQTSDGRLSSELQDILTTWFGRNLGMIKDAKRLPSSGK
jgi:pimeloyl-ACP methyl ester carboxylesterase